MAYSFLGVHVGRVLRWQVRDRMVMEWVKDVGVRLPV